jgi:hypothetical protein
MQDSDAQLAETARDSDMALDVLESCLPPTLTVWNLYLIAPVPSPISFHAIAGCTPYGEF